MITVEDWAEIRRLYRSEGLSKAAIARRLGISRNTVAKALASDGPPRYERPAKGSLVDAVEPRVRLLLAEYPTMLATVIAERIGWEHSLTILKDRMRELRPLYKGIDPADRVEYTPGEVAQCDLWFPPVPIPVGKGIERILPVLAMTSGYSRHTSAVMIPSRQGGDILAGMWRLLAGHPTDPTRPGWGRCPRALVWDRESAIGGKGKPTPAAAAFVGTLGVRLMLAPARDPEFKGLVERRNGFFETSFLPGRVFTSPADFNTQISEWLTTKANTRFVRSIGATITDRWPIDRAAMITLPPVAPQVGLRARVRLARDYYVRIDANDYSVDPSMIGRFVDVVAGPDRVTVTHEGAVAADHARYWGSAATITDPNHQATAKRLRGDYQATRAATARRHQLRAHADGHAVALRALPDYDALFGIDFHTNPTTPHTPEPVTDSVREHEAEAADGPDGSAPGIVRPTSQGATS